MIEPEPSPPRRWNIAATVMRGLTWLLSVMLLLLALFWGTLHGLIVPRIDEFRPALEALASRRLGVPVRIERLAAGSGGLVPSFELEGVALLDPQGREALRLPRVLVALSLQSVLRLGFDQLYLDRPELDIRRTTQGRFIVGGLDLAGSEDDPAVADWFFSQREFVIRGGVVRWTDDWRGLETLSLTGVDVVMRNGPRRHDMRMDATPPAEWGGRFVLLGQFRRPLLSTHASRREDWDGQVYGDFPAVDVSSLRRHVTLDAEVRGGRGAVRLWGDVVRGLPVGGMLDLRLADVAVRLAPGLEPLAVRTMAGRLGGRRLAGGFEFFTAGLQFETAAGLRWPGGNVFVSHVAAEGRTPALGTLRADRLDLAVLTQLASSLPLGSATHAALQRHDPRGEVERIEARWQGPLSAPQQYEVRTRVSGLGLPGVATGGRADGSAPGIPGLQGATVDLEFNQGGGRLRGGIEQGWLDLPGVFEEPRLRFDRLQVQAQWQVQGDALAVSQASIRFANSDAEGELHGSWRTADPALSSARSRYPGVADFKGTLSRANGARVYRYLPLHIPADVRHYLRQAVIQGQVRDVDVRIRGDLWDLPYADPRQGEFRFAGKVSDTTFVLVPPGLQPAGQAPWPALVGLEGELVFDRHTMRVAGARGGVRGAPGLRISRAEAQIPDLMRTATVIVTAELAGPLADTLRMVRGSPLSVLTGRLLDTTVATGDAGYRLRLNLPLQAVERTHVEGTVTLGGNDVQLAPDLPPLARARGVIGFSEGGFSVSGLQARLLGGDVRIDGGPRAAAPGAAADPAVVLRAQGTVSAEGLRQSGASLGWLARLAQQAGGAAPYTAVLTLRRGAPELSVSSSLQGLALNLPAPLAKPADTALPLKLETTLLREASGSGPAQEQVLVELGRLVQVRYQRELGSPQARVLRGSIAVGLPPGETVPLPEDGVTARGQLAQVSVDAWDALLGRLMAGGGGPSVAGFQPYLPTRMALRARELMVRGRRLDNVVVGGTREGPVWRATVNANQLSGYVEYRQALAGNGGRLHARLARLSIPAEAAAEVESLLNLQPETLPALDIVVDDLELRGRQLGRFEVEAVNVAGNRDEAAREWRLAKLNLSAPEATLRASGRWLAAGGRAAAPRRRTELDFALELTDAGALLGRLGMPDVIRRGRGRIEGRLGWMGSPLALDYPSLAGQFNVGVDAGQFLKAEPGIAKLLGVLSLQALPRRLTLDFRDVFSAGFAFDFIRGDVAIEQGIARTANLQMKGVNAAVLMEGQADIARETQDLRVVVVPEINAGSASLIATVVNPAMGLGTALAQLLLRQPLIRATTQEFHVDGTWADPRVTRVNRPASPAPAASQEKP